MQCSFEKNSWGEDDVRIHIPTIEDQSAFATIAKRIVGAAVVMRGFDARKLFMCAELARDSHKSSVLLPGEDFIEFVELANQYASTANIPVVQDMLAQLRTECEILREVVSLPDTVPPNFE